MMMAGIDVGALRAAVILLCVVGGFQGKQLRLADELQMQFCDQITSICFNGVSYQTQSGNACYENGQDTYVTCKKGTKSGAQNKQCCGQTAYNGAIEQCCSGGTVGPACCDGVAYDPAVLACCDDGKLGTNCCGTIAYAGQMQCCSDGVVAPACCGIVPYDPSTLSCCSDGNVGTNCCGPVAYDMGQCCSSGNVGVACCGDFGYDNTTLQCCRNGNIGLQCCSVIPYDPSTEECCNGVVYDPNVLKCCGGSSIGKACCGPLAYDNSVTNPPQCCSDGSLGKACCGGMGFNNELLKCCSDNVFGVECCGENAYTPAASLKCCYGEVVTIPTTGSWECCGPACCPPDEHVFNNVTHFCCQFDGSAYHPRASYPNMSCCGGFTYNTESHWCDGGVIRPQV